MSSSSFLAIVAQPALASSSVPVIPTQGPSTVGVSLSSGAGRVSSPLALPNFRGHVFLEHASYAVVSSLLREYRNLFRVADAPRQFYSVSLNEFVNIDVGPNDLPEGDVLFACKECVVVHLLHQDRLVRVVSLPGEWSGSVDDLCANLSAVYGGAFEPANFNLVNVPLNRFARTAESSMKPMNFVAYNWSPLAALPRVIPIRVEMQEFISFVELTDNFDELLTRVITVCRGGLSFLGQGLPPNYFIHVTNGPIDAPIVSFGPFSLSVILADSGSILKASFDDDDRHLLIWKSEGEGVNSLVHIVVNDELLQQSIFEVLHNLFTARIIRLLDDFDEDASIASLFPENHLVSRIRVRLDMAELIEGHELKLPLLDRPYVVTYSQPAFIKHVQGCSTAFGAGLIHSPYFAMVQSSGTGKTKLVIEAARAGLISSLYILCRTCQGSLASPFITDLESWVAQRVQLLDIPSLEGYLVDRLWTAVVKLATTEDPLFMSAPYRDEEELGNQIGFWHFDGQVPPADALRQSRRPIRKPLVIVFDEAKRLNTWWVEQLARARNLSFAYDDKLLFKALRRALITIYQRMGGRPFVMVVMDTSSSIANFLPTAREDPIGAYDATSTNELYPPFMAIDSFDLSLRVPEDVTEDASVIHATAIRIPDIGQNFITERFGREGGLRVMLTLGRPAWDSFLMGHQEADQNEQFERLLSHVHSRFHLPELDSRLVSHYLMPIAARVPLRLGGLNAISSMMVSRYLGLLYHCSEDRENLKVIFREEPVVGIAYSNLFWREPEVAKASLVALSKFLTEVSGEVGFFGEFSMQLLCMAAMDHASQGRPHMATSMGNFLSALVGSNVTLPPNLIEAQVSFCQFVRANVQDIGREHINHAVFFGQAIVPVSNNRGYDLLIPYQTTSGRIGLLLIEIKNREKGQSYSKAFASMRARISESNASGFECFGTVAIMGQGDARRMKFHFLFDQDERHDRVCQFHFVESNSWRCVPEMSHAVKNALASLKVSEGSFDPTSSVVPFSQALRKDTRMAFTSILPLFSMVGANPVLSQRIQAPAQATRQRAASAREAEEPEEGGRGRRRRITRSQ